MSEKPPFVAFMMDRWEGGVGELSHEAEYVYFRLCKAMWASGKGLSMKAARIACRFFPEFDEALAELVAAGKISEADGLLTNENAIEAHDTAKEKAEASRDRASKAARKRWGSDPGDPSGGGGDAPSNAPGNAPSTPSGNAPRNADPEPEPEPEKHEPEAAAQQSRARPREAGDGDPPAEPPPSINTWPPPEQPPEWASIDLVTRGLPAERLAEVWERWRNHRLARGQVAVNVQADWRNWCGDERKRRASGRVNGAGPPPKTKTGRRISDVPELQEKLKAARGW